MVVDPDPGVPPVSAEPATSHTNEGMPASWLDDPPCPLALVTAEATSTTTTPTVPLPLQEEVSVPSATRAVPVIAVTHHSNGVTTREEKLFTTFPPQRVEFDPATGRRVFHFYSVLPPPTFPDVAVTSNMLDQHGIREACTPHPHATVSVSVPVSVSVSSPEYSGREEHGTVVWVPDDPGHPPSDQSQPSDVCIARFLLLGCSV